MAETINFTDAELRKLAAPAVGRKEYKDGGSARSVNGLYLRVSSNGVKSFSVLKRISGAKAVRTTIGKFGSPWSVEEARKKALAILNDYASSKDPGEAKKKIKVELTLQQLFEKYIADKTSAGKRSTSGIRARFERYVGFMPAYEKVKHGSTRTKGDGGVDWSERKVSAITSDDIEKLHETLSKYHKVNANRIVELLRAVYNFGIQKKLATSNPAEKFTKNPEKPIVSYFKQDEAARFVEALAFETEVWQDFFLIMMLVGYRRSAVQSMAWSDLSGVESAGNIVWNVRGEKAKNGEPIALAVINEAAAILRKRYKQRLDNSIWVFEGGGRAGHVTSPEKAMKRILERAEISKFRIHDLRHNLATMLINSGVGIQIIGKVLGHKDPRSTSRYAHLQVDAAADALAKISWPAFTKS